MGLYCVTYSYDGGSGSQLLEADSAQDASHRVMAAAKPIYAADPATPCKQTGCFRVYTYQELERAVNAGITSVIDLTWNVRDCGLLWLVVERGSQLQRVPSGSLRDIWSEAGVLVDNCSSAIAAHRRAAALRTRAARQGSHVRYDVVRRDSVELRRGAGPYGCLAAEG